MLYAFDACGGAEIVCNDDAIGLQSQVTVQGTAGVPFIVIMEGYSTNSGPFILNVQ